MAAKLRETSNPSPDYPATKCRRGLSGLPITAVLLSLTLVLSIIQPAKANDHSQQGEQNQAKQCAATPAQALAQIRGQSTQTKSALINPNTASLAELMSLPGVGQTKARAIIAYRHQVGTFSTLDEITQVSGIGNKTYAKFKDRLTLAP